MVIREDRKQIRHPTAATRRATERLLSGARGAVAARGPEATELRAGLRTEPLHGAAGLRKRH